MTYSETFVGTKYNFTHYVFDTEECNLVQMTVSDSDSKNFLNFSEPASTQILNSDCYNFSACSLIFNTFSSLAIC